MRKQIACQQQWQDTKVSSYGNALMSNFEYIDTHTHTPVYRPFSGTTLVSRYQKGKTNLDFTEARDSE